MPTQTYTNLPRNGRNDKFVLKVENLNLKKKLINDKKFLKNS